jgi:cysteine desulfurase family protein (TIGR01976 family)
MDIASPLALQSIRSRFPALTRSIGGKPAVFLDGPAGTQVPRTVIEAVSDYFVRCNANNGGKYETSHLTDQLVANARQGMGEFFNCDAAEVVFGANMTSLTFAVSRAIGREIKPGDEVIVTALDHDANVAPWRALEERGAVVREVRVRTEDCTLDLSDLEAKLSARTRCVAVGYASNAVGTINPVEKITRMAHAVGALVYIDAVHFAPHGAIDVRGIDCDFLACSSYKFYGPHLGILYGRKALLERFKPYKVRPASDAVPGCWETGTPPFELLSGLNATLAYFAQVGERAASPGSRPRDAMLEAFRQFSVHEHRLASMLLEGLREFKGLRVFGITDPIRMDQRCSTIAIRSQRMPAVELAAALGDRGFFVGQGNCYALRLSEELGLEGHGGFVRLGLVHYNTEEEVQRLLSALAQIAV